MTKMGRVRGHAIITTMRGLNNDLGESMLHQVIYVDFQKSRRISGPIQILVNEEPSPSSDSSLERQLCTSAKEAQLHHIEEYLDLVPSTYVGLQLPRNLRGFIEGSLNSLELSQKEALAHEIGQRVASVVETILTYAEIEHSNLSFVASEMGKLAPVYYDFTQLHAYEREYGSQRPSPIGGIELYSYSVSERTKQLFGGGSDQWRRVLSNSILAVLTPVR